MYALYLREYQKSDNYGFFCGWYHRLDKTLPVVVDYADETADVGGSKNNTVKTYTSLTKALQGANAICKKSTRFVQIVDLTKTPEVKPFPFEVSHFKLLKRTGQLTTHYYRIYGPDSKPIGRMQEINR